MVFLAFNINRHAKATILTNTIFRPCHRINITNFFYHTCNLNRVSLLFPKQICSPSTQMNTINNQ